MMPMRHWSLLLLLGIISGWILSPALGYRFIIHDYQQHCFKETFLPGVDVRVEYLVAQAPGEAPPVNFVVKDGSGKVKLFSEKAGHETTTLTTETGSGTETYSFCFKQVEKLGKWNVRTKQQKPPPRQVMLKVNSVMETKERPNLAKDKDLDETEEALFVVEKLVHELMKMVDESRQSAEVLVEMDASTGRTMMMLGLSVAAVIVLSGLLQMRSTTRKLVREKVM